MSTRNIIAAMAGTAVLAVVGFSVYKIMAGQEVGFNEVGAIACLLIMFFSSITWGTEGEKDGILQEEELGQTIMDKSSRISYFLLTFFILAAAAADKLINGTIHIFLLILLGLSMVTLPFIEFLVSRKYRE